MLASAKRERGGEEKQQKSYAAMLSTLFAFEHPLQFVIYRVTCRLVDYAFLKQHMPLDHSIWSGHFCHSRRRPAAFDLST